MTSKHPERSSGREGYGPQAISPRPQLHELSPLQEASSCEDRWPTAPTALYPQFQAFFRTRQPPTLIVWGKNDVIFPAAGAKAYLSDLPRAELHLLDSGHFALEDKGEEIAGLMRNFLDRSLPR